MNWLLGWDRINCFWHQQDNYTITSKKFVWAYPGFHGSSDRTIAVKPTEDMDINCGTIAEGKEKVEEVGQKIFELIVNTASGNKSKSEINGYGDEEFNPWQVGVVM